MKNNMPLSRVEDILQATIDNTEYDKPPQSRVESLLIELKEVIEGGGGGSAYHAAGSVDYVSELPSPSADYLGYVYDITQAFTTTSDFKEGAGKRYPAGSNIAIVDVGTPESPSYKYDILSGFIDTSNFVEKEEGKGLSTNDYTNADKTKLASLENYDDTEVRAEIAEKADDADLAAVAKSGSYNDLTNTPDIPSKTSDLTNDSHFVNETQMDAAIDSTDISSSASGTSFALTDAADAPLAGLVIEGRTTSSGGTITNVGDNGLSVMARGKNLFSSLLEQGYIDIYGNKGNSDIHVRTASFMRLQQGVYTISAIPQSLFIAVQIWQSNTFGGNTKIFDSGWVSGAEYTFTMPENGKYMTAGFRTASEGNISPIDITGVQLELGTAATAYEPYKGSTAVLSTGLPLCSVGDVKDELDEKRGVAVKRCEKVVLDGSSDENWVVSTGAATGASGSKYIYMLNNPPVKYHSNDNLPNAISTLMLDTPDNMYVAANDNVICVGDETQQDKIMVRIAAISTVTDLRTYLAANPVTVVYELAEPYDVPMTASEISAYHNLRTFSGTTNITCTDSPQMILDYMLNTENGASVGQVAANFVGVMYSLMPYPNAGAHNAIYRGKYLGSAVTSVQWAAIKAGTFDDMYIGDYWVIGGRVWRIAAFDYYFNTGDTACTSHHVVIVPDAGLYTYKMNNAGTTAGGYVGSKMYTEGLVQALSIVETAFGAAHILERREFLTNAVTNGVPSGASIYSIKIWLMTEMNVYGCKIFSTVSNGNSRPANYVVDKTLYPLFMYDPQIIGANRVECWLRDIVTNETFACISDYGYAGYSGAANDLAVRPAFAIYQA